MRAFSLWLERIHLLGQQSLKSRQTQWHAVVSFQSSLRGFHSQGPRNLLRGQAELIRDYQSISRILVMGLPLSPEATQARLHRISMGA
jgi:hypothetical protein